MASDMRWIQGEVSEDPTRQDANVEKLLRGFVRALITEQQVPPPAPVQEKPKHD